MDCRGPGAGSTARPPRLAARSAARHRQGQRPPRLPAALMKSAPAFLIYHKSEGEIVTRDDPKGRATVFDALPKLRGCQVDLHRPARLQHRRPDGLHHRRRTGQPADASALEVEREYAVRVLGELTEEMIAQLAGRSGARGRAAQLQSCFAGRRRGRPTNVSRGDQGRPASARCGGLFETLRSHGVAPHAHPLWPRSCCHHCSCGAATEMELDERSGRPGHGRAGRRPPRAGKPAACRTSHTRKPRIRLDHRTGEVRCRSIYFSVSF